MRTLLHRLKKPLIWVGAFLVVLILFGFFGLPPLLKSLLTRRLSEALHREVSIQEIKINPLALSMAVKGILVKDRESPEAFVSLDELFVNLQSLSIFRRALILEELRLTHPFIRIIRRKDNSYNFSDLLGPSGSKAGGTTTAPPLRFSLNNIQVLGGGLDFVDEPKEKRHTVRGANISIPFVSTIPSYVDVYVEPAFSATINNTQYSLKGKTKPFADSRETTFDINIDSLDIPYYLAYVPVQMDIKILSAYLDAKTQLSFVQYTNQKRALTLKGDLALKQVSVNDPRDNPLLKLPRLDVSMALTEPLSKRFHLSRVSFQSLELHVRRENSGAFNIDSLLPRRQESRKAADIEAAGAPGPASDAGSGTPGPPSTSDASSPMSFQIDEIQMAKWKMTFSDLSRSVPFKTTLDPIDLTISNLSNEKDKQSRYALVFKTEANEKARIEGDFSLDPFEVKGKVDLKSVPIRKYLPYYADSLLFDVENGVLELSSDYIFAGAGQDQGVTLSSLSASVKSLRLKQRGEAEDFLTIPSISIRNTRFEQRKRELRLGEIGTTKGSVVVRRSRDGKLNVLSLLAPTSGPMAQPAPGTSAHAERPWLMHLGKFVASEYAIRLEDLTTGERVAMTAEGITLKADNLSTKERQTGNVSLAFRLNERGTVLLSGPLGLKPLSARLAVDVKDVDIRPAQPYFTDRVKIAVTNGSISASGNLSVAEQKATGLQVTYKGDTSLSHFSSVDKAHAEDFVNWGSLYLSDIDVGYNPIYVRANKVALADFYARLVVHPDGSLNLQQVLEAKPGEPPQASTTPSSQSPKPEPAAENMDKGGSNVRIQSLTLQGGRINFTDRAVKPSYSMSLVEIGGRVSGLSSEESTVADVELRGKLDQYAPLEIIGKINPLRKDLFVDLKAKFTDMDLSAVSPYSGKHLGYTIQKGKLSFDVSYQIVKKKLDSQNNVFFDQLTLGDRVESPSATNLPVRLAIALLKDRKGEIRLDIPVTGSLDDPKFSVWRIIIQILVNLIAKAATSPFALLGAAFGGGEEISYLEFDPGTAAITEANAKKLDVLIKALYDRPSLKLDIEGYVDAEKDKEGLKQYQFSRKLKAQKLTDLTKQGLPAVPVDELKIEPNEYEKFLTMAYKAEKFPKPRNILGFVKSLPVPEMEKLMLTNLVITDDDLRALAGQRAMRVKDAIVKSGKVEPERIFIIEPKSLSPERREKARDSRAEFKIK